MAKKKRRSANVARKREKRNRNQKSKHKQLALEKQRKLQFSKLDEEGIFELLMKSRELVDEPEFEKILFDVDETYAEISNFVLQTEINLDLIDEDEEDDEIYEYSDEYSENTDSIINPEFLPTMEDFIDFMDEYMSDLMSDVLAKLVTPEIIGYVKIALSNCEKRFKRTGDRTLADAAFIARTFFEVAPKEEYKDHPILEGILINTIHQIQLDELPAYSEKFTNYEDVGEISENTIPQLEDISITDAVLPISIEDVSMPDAVLPISIEDEYPAKALYRNCIGIEIKELLDNWGVNHPESFNTIYCSEPDQEIDVHIHITKDRLHLYAHSNEELTTTMNALETYCQSAVMFLARIIDKGGDSDGTE